MKTRVLIFDDDEAITSVLKKILDERGYEVFTFAKSGICPLFLSSDHKGISDDACSDVIISDLFLPTIDGLKLIKDRIDKGCKVRCRALISTAWSDTDWQYARKLGCRIFRKPFDLYEMLVWIDGCAQKVDPKRNLFNWIRSKKKD